jgi:hypothetical protein
VPFREFASDSGITAVFAGAIQYINLTAPSNGTEFGPGAPFSLTAVLSAIAITAETIDFATSTVPILGANGQANTLAPGDTATVTLPGTYGNLTAFVSTSSNCLSPTSTGTVSFGALTFPNVPMGVEQFFCVTGSGGPLELLGAGPSSGYINLSNATGFTSVLLSPGSSTDFLASANVRIEFPGSICYTNTGGSSCVAESFAAPVPALSRWGIGALAGMLLLFGAWMLKKEQTA